MQVGINVKAVAIGVAVDWIGTMVVSTVIGTVAGILLAVRGASLEQLPTQLAGSVSFLLTSGFFGLLCTAAGGFVAAHIARGKEMRHAFAMGVFSLLSGLLVAAIASDPSPLWYRLIFSLLVIPCALLGGYLRTVMKRSDIQPQPSVSQPPIPHP